MESTLLVQGDEAVAFAFLLIFGLIYLGLLIFIVAVYWKILTKAGEDGWKCLVPFYNGWVYAEIVGRPGWWGLLLFVPLVNIVFSILLAIDLAKSFGKDPAFAVGIVLLGPVFMGILAFGSAQYLGPAGPEGRPGWSPPGGGYGSYNQGYAVPQGGYQPPAGQQWGQAPQQQPQQWGQPPQQQPPPPQQGGWGDQSGWGQPGS